MTRGCIPPRLDHSRDSTDEVADDRTVAGHFVSEMPYVSHGNAALTPRHSPSKAGQTTTKRCIQLRLRLREGPAQLVYRLGTAPSTDHRILVDAHLNRLSHADRATGEPVRRYEHDHPCSMLHVDVKKLGNIPDGGGWRYVGCQQGDRDRAVTPDKPRNKWRDPLMGVAYVHTVIDDHFRVAHAEIHDDIALTATAVLVRAVEWFNQRGVTVERCCPTTAAPTAHTYGETPASTSASGTSARGRIGRRPTGRSSGSTSPWPTAEATPAATRARPSAAGKSRADCTTTTTTAPTQPAGTSRPSHN